jgi:hypothetical protein
LDIAQTFFKKVVEIMSTASTPSFSNEKLIGDENFG